MEIVKDNLGRFTYILGGKVITNCTRDVDCPGRSTCLLNATFLTSPQMCVCSQEIDYTGAFCENVGSFGLANYALNILACFFSAVTLFVALYDAYLMFKNRLFHRDALSTSFYFTVLALIWTMIQTGTATRFTFQTIPPDPQTGSKTDLSQIGPVSLAFSFLFSTLAMLNVSLVWIEIAENADKMTKSESNNVARYRKLLIGYYILFFGIITVSLIVGNILLAAVASLPGVVIIVVTYLVGYFKMKKLLQQYLSSEGVSSEIVASSSGKEGVRKMRESLKAIRTAALGISFATLSFVLWLGIWVLLGGFNPIPGTGFNGVALGFAWIAVALGNFFVLWYLHGTIRRKLEPSSKLTAFGSMAKGLKVDEKSYDQSTYPGVVGGSMVSNGPLLSYHAKQTHPDDSFSASSPSSEKDAKTWDSRTPPRRPDSNEI